MDRIQFTALMEWVDARIDEKLAVAHGRLTTHEILRTCECRNALKRAFGLLPDTSTVKGSTASSPDPGPSHDLRHA